MLIYFSLSNVVDLIVIFWDIFFKSHKNNIIEVSIYFQVNLIYLIIQSYFFKKSPYHQFKLNKDFNFFFSVFIITINNYLKFQKLEPKLESV